MSYNTSFTRYKSTYLAALDCTATGGIKGRALAQNTTRYFATFTVPTGEQLEAGDCVAMIRVPAGTTVAGGRMSFTALGSGVLLGLGDPFACGRLLGAVLATAASDLGAGNANVAGLDCGVIRKLGVIGDGCGIGYTFTCETDLCVVNLYGEGSASQGGWAGGGAAGSSGGTAGGAITGGTITVVLEVLPV